MAERPVKIFREDMQVIEFVRRAVGYSLTGSTRDDEDLTLRIPSDGGPKSLRDLLNRLDEHSIDVEEFSVHTPDLDDVFLALTGHPSTEENAQ